MQNKPTEVQIEFRTSREKELIALSSEETTLGKSSYAKYLAENKKHVNQDDKQKRMVKARETIENLRKWREENGIVFIPE